MRSRGGRERREKKGKLKQRRLKQSLFNKKLLLKQNYWKSRS
jgi:hypothetical protein